VSVIVELFNKNIVCVSEDRIVLKSFYVSVSV